MNDGGFTYTRHTDAELSECLDSIDFETHPRNARNLAGEIERRWLQNRQQLADVLTANSVAAGARFEDLDKVAARRIFWPFFRHVALIGLAFGIGILVLHFGVALMLALLATLAGQARDAAVHLAGYAYPLTAIMTMVPYTRFLLKDITRRVYGGYALRIVHPEPDATDARQVRAPSQEPGA